MYMRSICFFMMLVCFDISACAHSSNTHSDLSCSSSEDSDFSFDLGENKAESYFRSLHPTQSSHWFKEEVGCDDQAAFIWYGTFEDEDVAEYFSLGFASRALQRLYSSNKYRHQNGSHLKRLVNSFIKEFNDDAGDGPEHMQRDFQMTVMHLCVGLKKTAYALFKVHKDDKDDAYNVQVKPQATCMSSLYTSLPSDIKMAILSPQDDSSVQLKQCAYKTIEGVPEQNKQNSGASLVVDVAGICTSIESHAEDDEEL